MPSFSQEDVKQFEVANRIKAVLSSAYIELKATQPQITTASYNHTTGELTYDLITEETKE